jgi:hypothetical protein
VRAELAALDAALLLEFAAGRCHEEIPKARMQALQACPHTPSRRRTRADFQLL